jgi:hypothetical protein
MSTVREQYIVDSKGRRKAVVISYRRFRQLLEDLDDLSVVASRRHEKAITLEELERRMKKEGVL